MTEYEREKEKFMLDSIDIQSGTHFALFTLSFALLLSFPFRVTDCRHQDEE